jgi:hypothetical protein
MAQHSTITKQYSIIQKIYRRYLDNIYNNINKDIDDLIIQIKHKIYGPQKLTVEYNIRIQQQTTPLPRHTHTFKQSQQSQQPHHYIKNLFNINKSYTATPTTPNI